MHQFYLQYIYIYTNYLASPPKYTQSERELCVLWKTVIASLKLIISITSIARAWNSDVNAQLDKEALSIVFGVKKFNQCQLSQRLTILSDHKPLQHLFAEDNLIPTFASARIKRWAIILGAYYYKVDYRPGVQHSNADVLSRLPLPEAITDVPETGETILLMANLHLSPVTAIQIRQWIEIKYFQSSEDLYSLYGKLPDVSLKPFQQRKEELSVHDRCVLWGTE